MAPEIGNTYAVKLKDDALKKKVYKGYCDHIASGKPKQSYVYEDGDFFVTWQTIDKYIEAEPHVFNPVLMDRARSQRYNLMMNEGFHLMKGKYKNGSPVVWQTIMRNMFRKEGWDVEVRESQKASEQVQFALAEAKKIDVEN